MRSVLLLFLLSLFAIYPSVNAQKIYNESSGELLFQFSDIDYNNIDIPTNMRFTLFFHWGEYWNFDLTNNLGFYTGGALRNVGFITEDNGVKMKRRSYTLGVPIALKLGSFTDNFFLMGGAEYEWLFHYKQKKFVDGNKSKYSEWLSERTNPFIPSVFAGIQFPGGINLKFKYYLNDFLNKDFTGFDFGEAVNYSNYQNTQVFYISLSFNFRKTKIENIWKGKEVRYAIK